MKRADSLASFPAHVAAAIQKHELPAHPYSGANYERVGDAVWVDYAHVLVLRVGWGGDPDALLCSLLQLPGAAETTLLSVFLRFTAKRAKVRAAAEKLIALADANPRAKSLRDLRRLPGVLAEDIDLVSIRLIAANV